MVRRHGLEASKVAPLQIRRIGSNVVLTTINYGLLQWGVESNRIELLQKIAIPLMTNSSYTAHTTPLFIELDLLKIQDMFKLKLLQFYYKLSSNLLPEYFESYRDVIERAPVRELRQHYIHPPLIRRVYAECSPLFQLIELINTLKADTNDTILEKIRLKVIHIMFFLSKTPWFARVHMIRFVDLTLAIHVIVNNEALFST